MTSSWPWQCTSAVIWAAFQLLYGFLPPLSFPCMHNLRFHLQRGTEAHRPATTYAIFFRTPEKTKGNAVNNASNGSTLVLNRGAQPSKTCSIGQSNYKPIYFLSLSFTQGAPSIVYMLYIRHVIGSQPSSARSTKRI